MRYTNEQLTAELEKLIREKTKNGDLIDADWLAMEVINEHMDGFSKYEDFETCCIWGHARRYAGQTLRRFDRNPDKKEPQEDLFPHLQKYYERPREVRQIGEDGAEKVFETTKRIPREKLTAQERREIANELRAIGTSYIDHGDELDRETDDLIAQGLLESDE